MVIEKHDLLRRLLSSAEWVTGKTAAVLGEAHRVAPQIVPRSSVIHNGLAVPTLPPAPLPLAAPRLLCLGRLANQKGFDLALTAMASITNSFPGARLIVAGDGPERPRLEQLVAELGLNQVVDFLGWVSPHRVFDLINTATMLIMPSRWEGLQSLNRRAVADDFISLGNSMAPSDPIKLFIGSGEASLLERKTLIYSLHKHTRRKLDIYVFNGTHNSVEHDQQEPFPAPLPLKLKYLNGTTEFGLYRYLLSQVCQFQGKAIYLDSDIVCFAQIGELWDAELSAFDLLALANGLPDGKLCSEPASC